MKSIVLIAFWSMMLLPHCAKSQDLVLESKELKANREITVYLPSTYDSAKKYPTIYVLDGDRIGSSVFGINEYLATCERTMSSIVVAIHQDTLRWPDCNYSYETSELTASAKGFKAFLLNEVKPMIDSLYSTSSYAVLVGHSFTATFTQLLLLDNESPFKAFVSISPYISNDLSGKLKKWFAETDQKKTVFISTSEFDLFQHKTTITSLNKSLQSFKLDDDKYRFEQYQKKTHLTLVPSSIEDGLSMCFGKYMPLNMKTLSKKEMKSVDGNTLKKYYADLNEIYGMQLPIREEDLEFTLSMLQINKKWDELKLLAEESIVTNPDLYAGYYSLGYYYEELKEYKKALEWFELGYSKLGEEVLNKQDFYEDIERLKKKNE